jgi:cellulose synthase/poly-beta-1,6-N-acetylglucosamine synthase-like glycosyltransferase
MSPLSAAAGAVTSIVSVALHGYAAYCAAIAVGSVFARRRQKDTQMRANRPSVLAVVPAHDEEAVIGGLVASLRQQDYPPDKVTILVVADRCSDDTARVATEAGAVTLERTTGDGGKSAAIGYALARAESFGTFDVLAVFDADNRAARGFLNAAIRRVEAGEGFVQGRVDPKNPRSSWVAASSALGFFAISGLVQAPRERLGLSTPLMGTGWVASFSLARSLLESLTTLTDDLELAAALALRDVRIAYEETAVVFDEKPVRLGVAMTQRHRWMQGRWAVLARYAGPLVRRALDRDLPLATRARSIDQVVQLAGPSLLFTAVGLSVIGAIDWLARLPSPIPRPSPAVTLVLAGFYYLLPVPFIARFSPAPSIWWSYVVQPAYLALSAPLALSGFFTRRSKKWNRTVRQAP